MNSELSIYTFSEGRQVGPLHESVVRFQLSKGLLKEDDFGWYPGLDEWVRLGNLFPDRFQFRSPGGARGALSPRDSQRLFLPTLLRT